jgi:hypothetical protein
MEELINFLNSINSREIPVSTTFSQDFIDILNWSDNKKIDIEVVRDYLKFKNQYTDEKELQLYMRDLYTQYVVFNSLEHRKKLNNLLTLHMFNIEGEINNLSIYKLIESGFKCYPVSYSDKGPIFGIITKLGNVIIEPRT